ncbi:helix-turn-helix transcriptional regulator [Thiohalorhabdus sp.]|uniref:helix-turn-helix transcriptional regulator n=1 Tax=Thiohalorhabdus sp. TaxID=3094134 RepID=UPI002FC36DCF
MEEDKVSSEVEGEYTDRWLNVHDVMAMLAIRGRSTLTRRIRRGDVPRPFYPFGENGGGRWWESEILEAMRKMDYREPHNTEE